MHASPLLTAQSPPWQTGIAQVKVRDRSPGAAFVGAVHSGRAYLLTSAHVVEDDASPDVVFVSDPYGSRLKAEVSDREAKDPRGLALLFVASPRPEIAPDQPPSTSISRSGGMPIPMFRSSGQPRLSPPTMIVSV
jgi:hypothetical protein